MHAINPLRTTDRFMKRHTRNAQFHLSLLALLIFSSLACSGITITLDNDMPTPTSVLQTQQIGFDFSKRLPASPKGDDSARRHLFLHEYSMPSNGYVIGIMYLNDGDTIAESFDLLLLRPNDDGWKVMYRISLSDDTTPAQTGTTEVRLSSPLPVQRNDIFAHWQDGSNGAIPLNLDNESVDGFSMGQYGFQPSDVEIGRQIAVNGFSGRRDYFINIVFLADP